MLYNYYARKKFHNLTKALKLSGYPLTFLSNGKSLKNYKIYGNSIQNGTPTLENPIEVQSLGDLVTDESSSYYGKYRIPVKCSGKNLYDKTYNPGVSFTNSIILNPGDYTFSFKIENASKWRIGFSFYDENKNNVTENYTQYIKKINSFYYSKALNLYMLGADSTKTAISFSVISTCNICFKVLSGDITSSTIVSNVQVERGLTATEYEPYSTPVTTNIYLNEPLRKIDNYADYIDYKNQKVVRNIGEKILDENTPIAIASWRNNSTTRGFLTSRVDEKSNTGSKISVFCNKLKNISYNDNYGAPNYSCISHGPAPYGFAIRIEDLTLTTTSAIKQWLLNNPLTVNYLLKTPIEESVVLPKISTVKGTNILTTDTIINPSDMEIEYYK